MLIPIVTALTILIVGHLLPANLITALRTNWRVQLGAGVIVAISVFSAGFYATGSALIVGGLVGAWVLFTHAHALSR